MSSLCHPFVIHMDDTKRGVPIRPDLARENSVSVASSDEQLYFPCVALINE